MNQLAFLSIFLHLTFEDHIFLKRGELKAWAGVVLDKGVR